MEEQGAAQSARLKQQIAEQEFLQKQLEFQTRYRNLRQEYLKWQESWSFCREETLPLAREQRKGSVLAFQEGELDYTAFIQNLREALQTELDAMETQLHYLQARSELEFYLDTNKP